MSAPENIELSDVNEQREQYSDPHHIIITRDNASLFLRSWPPEEQNNQVAVLILHGITAYSKPYEIMAIPLQEKGYQVFGLDLRGHGLSTGNRGDYKSEQILHDDLSATLNFIRKSLGYKKIVLLGHSLGVLTSLKVVYYNIQPIDGLVLFSAALETREGFGTEPSLWRKLKILFFSIFKPDKPVITYYREGIKGLDDPLFNFQYTLRFFKIFNVDNITFPVKLDYPFYMGIGDQDEIFSVNKAKELFTKIESDDATFNIFEGSKHADFTQGAFENFVEWFSDRY